MNKLVDCIKLPLYRVIINLAIGVFAFLFLHDKIFNEFKWMLPLLTCGLLSKWYFFIPVILVIGEVFSFAGEMILNFFFMYNPLRKPEKTQNSCTNYGGIKSIKMEKVVPCSETYIGYKTFNNDPSAFEVSEIHFVLSRLFAGLMAIAIGVHFLLLPFILCVIVFALTHFLSLVDETSNYVFMCNVILLLLLCLSIFVLFCSFFQIEINMMHLKQFSTIAFCALASIYYRAHANQILYAKQENNG